MATVLVKAFGGLVLRATDSDYPHVIHFPHSLLSVVQYRLWRLEEGVPSRWLYDLVMSFFTHSMGGGVAIKAMLGGPLSDWCSGEFMHFHVISYLAAYFSPRDVVYRAVVQPRHPARLVCVALDALDSVTTACGAVDSGLKANPHNKLLPAALGIALYNAGSVFRWFDQRIVRNDTRCRLFLEEPTSAVLRGVSIVTFYLVFGRPARGY